MLRLTAESSITGNKQEVDSVHATNNEVLSFEGATARIDNAYDDIKGSANWSEKDSSSSLNVHKRRSA